MKNLFWVSGFLFVFFLFSPQKSLAATFTFSGQPSSILDNQNLSVNVNLSISGSSGDVYYIRGDLASVNSPTAYFGYTQDNLGNWYNGKPTFDYTKLFKVTMVNNQWSGTIQLKPDINDTGYKGSGNYNLKLRRYKTSSSSYLWSDNTAQLSIISSSTPIPTPTPTPTPAPFPTPVPVESSPPIQNSTQSDGQVPTPTDDTSSTSETSVPNPTSISINLFDNLKATTSSKSVLPVSTKASSLNSTPISKEEKFLADKEINFSKILIALGFIIIVSSAGFFIKSIKR